MSHAYHEALPGFHVDQILHDGCDECEQRAQQDDHGISSLDVHTFMRAVDRAVQWNKRGLPTISVAERPMLSTLWSVWIQMERKGLTLFSAAS